MSDLQLTLLDEDGALRVLVTGATGYVGSRLVPELLAARPGPRLDLHPATAQGLGIGQGDPVVITSAHGEAQATAHLTPDIRQDTVFLAFHFAGAGNANLLTGGPTDPVSGMPEFKTTPVRVTCRTARTRRDGQAQEVYA